MVYVLLLIVCLPAGAARAESATSLFEKANQLYRDGKYEEAIEAYQDAREAGGRHPDLFYNLGNAYLRQGDLGRAIANYLRAQRLDPRDPDIRFNLEYARDNIEARLKEIEKGPFTRAFNAVVSIMSANEWSALLIACYWLIAAAAAVWLVATGPAVRQAAMISFFCFLIVFILLMPLGAMRVKRDFYTPRAVVVSDKVTGRSGPAGDNAEIIDLYEGMDVELGSCRQEWCRVRGGGGFVVWVPADALLRL
ncbi:MAG: tetratricopeptide repeat protein [bacterium]